MCPSRMARTASQIGSLKSSPSTSTVKNAGDRAVVEIPGALADLRKQAEDRGRVALLAGRFAGRQADLALRHGEARDGIHHQQHVLALVAEVLGDGERDEAGAHAQRRGPVRRGDDHHGAPHTLRARGRAR